MPRGFPWGGGRSWKDLLDVPVTVEASDGNEVPPGLPDFFHTISLHFVSTRLRLLLENAGAEIEFWPASVHYAGQVDANSYFVANPLIQLPALDIERSAVELDDMGLALSAEHVVLDEAKLANTNWAKVRELQQVVVSSVVQNALRESGFSGFQLVESSAVRL